MDSQEHRGFLAQKGLQLPLEPLGRQVVLANHCQRPVSQVIQSGNDMGTVDLSQAGGRSCPTALNRIQQLPELWQLLQGL